MYHPSKVAFRIAEAEREFGLSLERHTPDEVDAFESHLVRKSLYTYDDLGRPSGTRNLSDFERDWMLNEQLLTLCDAEYFLTRYCIVKDEENVIRRFEFRVAQRVIFDVISDLEARDAAIEVMILKARQLGISTLVQLLVAHRIIFSYGVTAVIGSADQDKTTELSRMLLLCYDSLPVWLRPEPTSRVESQRGQLVFGHLATGVRFQHGSQKLGIATGSTPTIYHLSEVAMYTDHLKLVDEGLWKAVHASPSVLGILESTGRGNKGWWAETWYRSRDHWPNTRMCPLFLPWFVGREMYPKPADMRIRPVPTRWHPRPDTLAHVAKAELYVRSHPLLSRYLGSSYQMPVEQQWYWEWNHEDAVNKSGGESSFLQEMAGDDEEALQRSEESVFGHSTITAIDNERKRDYLAYGLSGQSIEDAHEPPPEDIDYSAERVPVRFQSRRTGETHRWELLPLKFDRPLRETDPEDAAGKLFVFFPPQPGVSYSMGIDTGQGKGEDSTVISVWAIGGDNVPDCQAAEFASPYVNHVEAYAFAVCIGAYYGQFMSGPPATRWRFPYVAVEQVEAVGDTCQLQMIRMGYPVGSFHRMTRLDSQPSRIAAAKRGTSAKLGWFTYGWSRPILTTNFVHFVGSGWSKVHSPWLLEEMRHYEVHYTARGKERLEHEEDYHDDRIMAAAMSVFCPQDTKSIVGRSKKRAIEISSTLPELDTSDYRGQIVPAAALRRNWTSLSLDDIARGDYRGPERYR
jgi:hypothetical protein